MFEVGAEGEVTEIETELKVEEPGEKSISSYFASGTSLGDDPFASVVQVEQDKSDEEEFLSLPPASTVTALPDLEAAATASGTAVEDTRDQETIITAEISGKAYYEVMYSLCTQFHYDFLIVVQH